MALRYGQVIHYYVNYGTAEIVMTDNGQRFQNVTVLSPFISSNTGVRMHHAMMRPDSEQQAGGLKDKIETDMPYRSVLAACIMEGGRPFILGFISHPMGQLMFLRDERNRDIYRHPAGNNINTERHGNYEVHHTGGAFLKIGKDVTNAAGVAVDADRHEDLTPLCANENWTYPLNDPVTITVVTGDQGENAVKIRIRPNGDVDWMGSGYLHIRHAKDLHVDIGEQAEVHITDFSTHTAGGDIKIRTPANVTITAGGDATLQAVGNANVYAGGNATVAAGGNSTIAAAGNVMAAAGGNASVGAVGSLTAAAGGNATIGAAGPVTVAGGPTLTLAAAEITAVTGALVVTGEIIELGQVAAAAAGAAIGAAVGATGAAIGAQGIALGAQAVAAAPPEVAAAQADLAEAAASIEAAVQEATETSLEAVGTGDPDNVGLSSDPAPDVP